MLLTNIDVLGEGMLQNHCVGSYINRINEGKCAIFHIEGFTLEVSNSESVWLFTNTQKSDDKLFYVQFRGHHNSSPPKHLEDAVNSKIKEFNTYLRSKKKDAWVIMDMV